MPISEHVAGIGDQLFAGEPGTHVYDMRRHEPSA